MDDFSRNQMKQKIDELHQLKDLRKLRDAFHENFQSGASHQDMEIFEQIQWINQVHDLFIQRTIQLAEANMVDIGKGPPPVSYDFVLFGSGGREEQTLWSDQDNGILYDRINNENKAVVEAYFAELSTNIVKGLEEVGYPPCDGEVVCSRPRWRQSIEDWTVHLRLWFEEPNWENVRYLLITADVRSVYGSGELTKEYKKSFNSFVESQPTIVSNMMQNTLRHKILLGIFGHLIKEQYGEKSGGIDIKYGAYIPIVNGIRLLAIQAGIVDSSTKERIRILLDRKLITSAQAETWMDAFANFLRLRTMTYYEIENGHYTSNGILKAKECSKGIINELKASLRIGKEMQRYIERNIGR